MSTESKQYKIYRHYLEFKIKFHNFATKVGRKMCVIKEKVGRKMCRNHKKVGRKM